MVEGASIEHEPSSFVLGLEIVVDASANLVDTQGRITASQLYAGSEHLRLGPSCT